MASLVSVRAQSSQEKIPFLIIYLDESYYDKSCFCCCLPNLSEHIYVNHDYLVEPFDKNKATHKNEDAVSRERIKQIVIKNLSFIKELPLRESTFKKIDEDHFLYRKDAVLMYDIERINSIFMEIQNS